ncbi:MAG: glycoside hydrolase family 2 TIM barrel-domain containing protein [Bacteroidales bacterium]
MKHTIPFLILLVLAVVLASCDGTNPRAGGDPADRERLFNADWKFTRDSLIGAEEVGYDDSGWGSVDLPHDYSMMPLPGGDGPDQVGPFSKKAPGNGNATGQVPGGTGWYRKHFTLDRADKGKTVFLDFDGVYMESGVWVNGQKAGVHKNGYTPFLLDITSFLNPPGEENVIAVRVDNPGRNSRWYTGSGIYRDVRLLVTDPVRVEPRGVFVTTPEVGPASARVQVAVTLGNALAEDAEVRLAVELTDPDGIVAGTAEQTLVLPAGSREEVQATIDLASPRLWSIGNPALYSARIRVSSDRGTMDRVDQTFGIRSLSFSAEEGFLLNGEPVLLNGACIHHDHGLLGAASFARAEERRVALLKENGFNAIRAAHNPYSRSFLEACDRLGMLVIDEFTDMWETHKSPQDHSRFFRDEWKGDLRDWVLRDRNHPSVILWSIGNEIFEPVDSTRLRIGTELAEALRELDPTRGLTLAITGFFYPKGWASTDPMFSLVDVCGYNYMIGQIEADRVKHPERVIYTSESYATQAYDYWAMVEKHPHVIGDFVWTAWDYLGEVSIGTPTYVPVGEALGFDGNFTNFTLPEGVNIFDLMQGQPSAWPRYLADCGDIDITGGKTAQMRYRDVLWKNSEVEILVHEPVPEGMTESASAWAWPREFPRWNWEGQEGRTMQVRVFTRFPEVRLELNGKLVGQATLSEKDEFIASFDVPYQSGELKAVCLDDGREVATRTLSTAGAPAAIRLEAEQPEIRADRNDIAFVTIHVLDDRGRVSTGDSTWIQLRVEGPGEWIAAGNAANGDMESFNRTRIRTYQGRAQVVVRSTGAAGEIVVSATAEGLEEGRSMVKAVGSE